VQVVDGGRVWAQQAGDPRVAWLTQQLASASLSNSRVSSAVEQHWCSLPRALRSLVEESFTPVYASKPYTLNWAVS
jgi:hypothetical protein